ncbi:MAG: hypothetical protein AAFQ09_10955, partial [Pseudomonadota bacterium]
ALLPLHALRNAYPDLYAAQMKKYQGREAILDRPMPELGCRWGDCVLFSPVHPLEIRAAFDEAGHEWPANGIRFLALDPVRAGFSADNTAVWLYENTSKTSDMASPKPDVIPYTLARIAELGSLPDRTRAYLRRKKAAGQRPLFFIGIPHVLHRGSVALNKMEELAV